MNDDIQVGSIVRYTVFTSATPRKGVVTQIVQVIASAFNDATGSTLCFICYDTRCMADIVNIKDVRKID